MESIALALSPFALNAAMAATKWLAGNNTFSKTGKRGFLALFALVGVVAFHAINDTPVDANRVSELLLVIVESFSVFVLSHGTYKLFWDPPKR